MPLLRGQLWPAAGDGTTFDAPDFTARSSKRWLLELPVTAQLYTQGAAVEIVNFVIFLPIFCDYSIKY